MARTTPARTAERAREILASVLRGDASALIAANFASLLLGVVTGVVTARLLGPGGRGDLAVVLFWPALLTSFLDGALLEAVAVRASRRPGGVQGTVRAGYLFAGLSSLIAAGVGIAGLPLVLTDAQQNLLPLARYSLVFVPLSLLSCVPVGALLGLQRFRAVAAVRVSNVVLYLAAVIVSVATGMVTVEWVAAMAVAARGVPLLLAGALLVRCVRGSRAERGCAQELAQEASRMQGARVVAVLSASEDRVLASLFLTQSQIGSWQVVATMAAVMPAAAQALGQKVLASVSRAPAEDVPQLVSTAYVRSIYITTLIVAALLPALPVLVPLLYGEGFQSAIWPAAIVAGGSVMAAGAMVLQSGARASSRVGHSVRSEVIGGVAMAIAAIAMMETYGMVGLAIAFCVGRAATVACFWPLRNRWLLPGVLMPFSPEFFRVMATDLRRLLGRGASNREPGVGVG